MTRNGLCTYKWTTFYFNYWFQIKNMMFKLIDNKCSPYPWSPQRSVALPVVWWWYHRAPASALQPPCGPAAGCPSEPEVNNRNIFRKHALLSDWLKKMLSDYINSRFKTILWLHWQELSPSSEFLYSLLSVSQCGPQVSLVKEAEDHLFHYIANCSFSILWYPPDLRLFAFLPLSTLTWVPLPVWR